MALTFKKLPELSERDIERFWNKVDKQGNGDVCWDWLGRTDNNGYAYLDWSQGRQNKLSLLAPRVSYFLAHGTLPIDKKVSCSCGNQKCVNPSHLFLTDGYFKYDYKEGEKIGSLIFVNRVDRNPDKPYANFRCECGKEFITRIDGVKSGRTTSCGCKTIALRAEKTTKHLPKETLESGIKLMPTFRPEDCERFWQKVNLQARIDVCWNWLGTGNGRYGYFNMGKAGYFKANRVAYYLYHNIDPKENHVLHECDNPACCNPHHLFLGTHTDNMRDMVKKGRNRNINTFNNKPKTL